MESNLQPPWSDAEPYRLHLAMTTAYREELLTVLREVPHQIDTLDNHLFSPIGYAAFLGHVDAIQILHAHGANVNVRMLGGKTPLMLAMLGKEIECVKQLLACGADVSLVDANDKNVLDIAVALGHMDIAMVLVENGARFSTQATLIKRLPRAT